MPANEPRRRSIRRRCPSKACGRRFARRVNRSPRWTWPAFCPEVELRRLWERIGDTAQRQGVSAFDVSGLVTLGSLKQIGKVGSGALSSVQAAGTLLDRHVFDHYREVLGEIEAKGFYPSLATVSRPYTEAVWRNFAADRPTLTEEFLATGGVRRTWHQARDWVRRRRGES